MKKLSEVISILFKKVSIYEVLKYNDRMDIYNDRVYSITKDAFLNVAGKYYSSLTNDEIMNLYDSIKSKISYEEELLNYRQGITSGSKDLRVFDALLVVANQLLDEYLSFPVCKYENILIWRQASHELDPDLYISAFLAYKDIVRDPIDERNFCWKPIISSNNIVLQSILNNGISENHFHLNGSAQHFSLSWINLMNHVESTSFKVMLDKIDEQRLNPSYNEGANRNDSLYLRCLKAACVRLHLFVRLLSPGKSCCRDNDNGGQTEDYGNIEFVRRVLKSDEPEATVLCFGIDTYISAISSNEFVDYAQRFAGRQDEKNEYLCGERWLMYSMLKRIYNRDESMIDTFNLFYVYILLKEAIRSELVQNNSVMGFDNFNNYNNRKSNFVDNTPLEPIFHRTAIVDTLENQPMIKSLEVRISPRNTAKENYNYIRRIEKNVTGREAFFLDEGRINDGIKQKFFYVMHFIKEKDKPENLYTYDLCRHAHLRDKVKRQAKALMDFRKYYPETAARVKGIDAANSEINCRPEVFAHAFRTLKEHEIVKASGGFYELSKLGVTYHVGEDFIDIIDGLRAIDEAILFFNMRYGDRLGHALALGINTDEWYQLKGNHVVISQQDYLDNVVWLYSKIMEYGIDVDNSLMPYLRNEFYVYFRNIYQDNMPMEYFDKISKESGGGGSANAKFDISTYYDAWKLRGDDPEKYISGKYENFEYTDIWEWNCVNREFPTDKSIRKSQTVSFLYYTYHYNARVKKEGEKKIDKFIPGNVQEAVKKVQDKMQEFVANKGLVVEANPSSNCLIGPFGKYSYDKHPILNFYNWGLGMPWADNKRCHQVSVCINTDDQAIFGTSLENEYALIARTLEKIKDDMGMHKYSYAAIYEWLNNIRDIGNRCVFSNVFKTEENTLYDEKDSISI